MEHKKKLSDISQRNFENILNQVLNQNYNPLINLVEQLSNKLKKDAEQDSKRGNKNLSNRLTNASNFLRLNKEIIKEYKEINYSFLAEELGNLRYDGLENYLRDIAEKIKLDSLKNLDKKSIWIFYLQVDYSAEEISKAWKICKKYM
jgi:hypothetical protein